MSLATVQTRAKLGIQAPAVSVEVHLSNGLPAFHIVGLPETAVKESKDRVRSAIINAHFDFPARRITVNLAPAEVTTYCFTAHQEPAKPCWRAVYLGSCRR